MIYVLNLFEKHELAKSLQNKIIAIIFNCTYTLIKSNYLTNFIINLYCIGQYIYKNSQ